MGYIRIEFEDLGGWRSAQQLPEKASAQQILIAMRQVAENYRTQRVRAVDQDGRVVDRL